MKKGYGIFVISIVAVVLFITSTKDVNGTTYNCIEDPVSPTPCVCGHAPNSLLGYGQVIFGGELNYSCDNDPDPNGNVCPEDYQDPDTLLIGNCSNCPDEDCHVSGGVGATVYGTVTDSDGDPIAGAKVEIAALYHGEGQRLTVEELTDASGEWSSGTAYSGNNQLKCSATGYDTYVEDVLITRGVSQEMDCELLEGTCHDDCTNSYGRCNNACQGILGCSFQGYDEVTLAETMAACNNVEGGKTVFIKAKNVTHSWYVDCCEGQPYPKYNAKADASGNENIKNLVKTEKIVRYGYGPSRLVIAYWR